ncbi:hypothetical protein AAHE18_10G188200 [Arachis hypogaea]|nr:Putative disease resistance RPP13-like protein [Arachis hypogaea]
MAAAIVGGALLSASVQVVLDKIISNEFLDFFRRRKLNVSLLGKMKMTLLSVQAVLNDAEEKQITNPAVKEWLNELTQAVFDAEDLLDEINTEALGCKVKARYQSPSCSAKVRNVFSSRFGRSYGMINSKMQTLFERLEHFAQQIHILQLKEGVSNSVWQGTPTSSVVDESVIYGRDDERKKLREYFLSEDVGASGNKIGVISIVGMGGIGKTTLAKLLYNDNEVKDKFDLKAWACVSKDFDLFRVTKTVLESVTSKTTNTDNLNTLQVELQQRLWRKRFLLVLDDIRGTSYVDWANLKDIFNAGEMGSTIIVTTRDENVAKAMQTFPIFHLTSLDSEDCWSLLAEHAFGANNSSERSNLEGIGREIVKKCDGLPLAAVALGGLLRTKLSKNDWNKVLRSNIWDLPNLNVQPALLLSYHFLPAPLKRCFAYCSIFPKNSALEKEMVVRLWIAEGLVHVSKSKKILEEVGDEYFDELVSRSLIRRRSMDGKSFEMHDLINDLAAMVSSAYCIRYEDQKALENPKKVRHLSYNRSWYDYFNKFNSFYGLECLRTFLPLPLNGWSFDYYLSNKVIYDLLPKLKQLRVLSLSHYKNISELPDSIGGLKHLRHLDLSGTNIKRLPSVVCKLYNLQTLLLSDCKFLTELPEEIGMLVNLRHLDISGTQLQEIPAQIARLENLQTLSGFVVSRQQNGLKVGELQKFPNLQGKLCISKLQNIVDPCDASQANMKKKEQIEDLSLEWDSCTAQESQHLVLEHLQPSTNLKKLTIKFYGGTWFPNWLGNSSFANMVYLCIRSCHYCSLLPPVGQLQNLKELIIFDIISVKTIGPEFYGCCSPSFQPFPSLETLSFGEMPAWEEWNFMGGIATHFPRLSHLSLSDCPKLKGNLPSNLPSLTKLHLSSCSLLEVDNRNIINASNLFSELMLGLNSLEQLHIEGIPSRTAFPRDGLPETLRVLFLKNCENFEFPNHESLHSYTALESLTIWNSCCSLTSFPLGSLPVLKWLYFIECKNLKSFSISEEEDAPQCLTFLQGFYILECPELESFPHLGLPTPKLRRFWVSYCNKLNSLPEPINALVGLQELTVLNLPNMQFFANEGLPISLRTLRIGNLGGNFSNADIIKWGLDHLTCLSELEIEGGYLVNMLMKMEVPLLPSTLISLHIYHLDGIRHLDGKWLQNLTSLECLKISSCDSLESLPQEGLPSSLSVLTIGSCPLLEASCRSNGGKEWPKVAHIPCIIMDKKVII